MAEKTICPLYNEWRDVLPGVPYPGRPFIEDILGASIDTLNGIKYNPTSGAYSYAGGEWIIPGEIPSEEEVIKTEAPKKKRLLPWEENPDEWEMIDMPPFGKTWKKKVQVVVGSDVLEQMKALISALFPEYELVKKA